MPASQACECDGCRKSLIAGAGLFVLRTADYRHYVSALQPMQLRDKITSVGTDDRLPAMNFGESKGRSFDHVVILPTNPMRQWLADPTTELQPRTRAKFYVALTRARYSVAIAMIRESASPPIGFSFYDRTV